MLDPSIKRFLDDYRAAGHAPYSHFTPMKLREQYNQNFSNKSKPEPIDVTLIEEHYLASDNHELKCRVYYPDKKENGPFPALMYFHGGGFVIRDNMDVYDQTCRMMCSNAQCVVVAVDFSLAPEKPFPAAPEDCYQATCWVAECAELLHVDVNRLGVWGESCGGNLATVVAMMARDRNGPSLCCQLIITAMLDYKFDTDSYRNNGKGDYFLTEDSMRWFWQHYLSDAADVKNPYCAPLQASNLSGLPRALVVTVEYDPLRDEGEYYAQQLESANVATRYICYPGLIHGFFDLYSISEKANDACKEIIALAKDYLNNKV